MTTIHVRQSDIPKKLNTIRRRLTAISGKHNIISKKLRDISAKLLTTHEKATLTGQRITHEMQAVPWTIIIHRCDMPPMLTTRQPTISNVQQGFSKNSKSWNWYGLQSQVMCFIAIGKRLFPSSKKFSNAGSDRILIIQRSVSIYFSNFN